MSLSYLHGSSFPDLFRFELESPYNALSSLVVNNFDPSSVSLPRFSNGSSFSSSSSRSSMDPISLGAAGLSGGFGLLGNLINQNFQKKALQAQMAFSQQQQDSSQAFAAQQANQSMAFNAAQAQLSRDFTERMYNKSYADNSPLSQLRNLKAAGLNPDLLYSSIGSGQGIAMSGSSATSSPASAGVGGSLGLPSPMDFSSFANAPLAAAQSRLLNAQADNLESDTRSKDIDNFIKDLTKGNLIAISDNEVKISDYQRQAAKYDPDIAFQSLNNLVESRNKMQVEIEHMTASINLLEQKTLTEKEITDYKNIEKHVLDFIQKTQSVRFAAEVALAWSSVRLNNARVNSEKSNQVLNDALSKYYGSLKTGQDYKNVVDRLHAIISGNIIDLRDIPGGLDDASELLAGSMTTIADGFANAQKISNEYTRSNTKNSDSDTQWKYVKTAGDAISTFVTMMLLFFPK